MLFICLFVVVIVDPGISKDNDSQSYNDRKKWDVFIKVTAFMQQMCILLSNIGIIIDCV